MNIYEQITEKVVSLPACPARAMLADALINHLREIRYEQIFANWVDSDSDDGDGRAGDNA